MLIFSIDFVHVLPFFSKVNAHKVGKSSNSFLGYACSPNIKMHEFEWKNTREGFITEEQFTFTFHLNRHIRHFQILNFLQFSRIGDSTSQPVNNSMDSTTNVDKQVTSREFDSTHQSMSSSEKRSMPYSTLIKDTEKYEKSQLHFLENPKTMYSQDFDREGFSIGVLQSVSSTDVSLRNVSSMYISRSRPPAFGNFSLGQPPTYDSEEASRISFLCKRILSPGLENLSVLVLYQVLLDKAMLQSIGHLKLELLHLVSCWWDLGYIHYDPPKTLFKRLHITQYNTAAITGEWLLSENLEELIVNSHHPFYKPFYLYATNCDKLKHV